MGATGPKRDLDAERRILEATRSLIAARGPNQVSINDIAAEAGVGKQTIYRWWPSKSAVVIDALERIFETDSPFPDTGSVRDDLRSQMRRVAAAFASPTGSIIRQLVADSQGDHSIAAEFRTRFFDQRRVRARSAIATGIDRGEIRADIPLETVIDTLYAPLWLRMLTGHQPLTPKAADEILDLVWPAIASTPRKRPAPTRNARSTRPANSPTAARPALRASREQ
jgi:AcrR family transcriptional regulator